VYFSETAVIGGLGTFRIRRIDAATGILTTVASTLARGLAADAAGNVYYTNDNRIWNPDGSAFAGTGVRGFSGSKQDAARFPCTPRRLRRIAVTTAAGSCPWESRRSRSIAKMCCLSR
jgi:hypothetical protein